MLQCPKLNPLANRRSKFILFRSCTMQQRVYFIHKSKFCNNCIASSHLKTHCSNKNICLYKRPHTSPQNNDNSQKNSALSKETTAQNNTESIQMEIIRDRMNYDLHQNKFTLIAPRVVKIFF